MAGKSGILLALLLFPLHAFGDDSCYRDHLVVDRIVDWDFSQPQRLDLSLPSRHPELGLVPTNAVAHFALGEEKLQSLIEHKGSGVGLAYNFYRVDFLLGEEGDPNSVLLTNDLTGGCKGGNPSLFPGRFAALFPMKIPRLSNGEIRGRAPMRIRIWGKLF